MPIPTITAIKLNTIPTFGIKVKTLKIDKPINPFIKGLSSFFISFFQITNPNKYPAKIVDTHIAITNKTKSNNANGIVKTNLNNNKNIAGIKTNDKAPKPNNEKKPNVSIFSFFLFILLNNCGIIKQMTVKNTNILTKLIIKFIIL